MRKGWFEIDGVQTGDRTLEQQLEGLRPLFQMAPGKSVLDVGCAEGLISIGLHDLGARVHGIDVIPEHIAAANRVKGGRAILFDVADAAVYRPTRQYDIVLMLAVLHKLPNPSGACLRFADAARETCVIRLPPDGAQPKPIAGRGECNLSIIHHAMTVAGFRWTEDAAGPLGEWTSYWKRT